MVYSIDTNKLEYREFVKLKPPVNCNHIRPLVERIKTKSIAAL